jgi:SAM-dependent methyltransferase
MLAQAAQKLHGTPLVQAAAGTLPISMNCCSGIAAVHALHHFPDQDRFLHQAYRCLVEGGGLLVVGMNAHAEDIDWYIYDFFEGTAERDRARFLSYSELSTRLQELGFRRVERGLAKLIDDVQIGAAVLEQPFLQRRGCSQLALLSDEEYERGLLRVRAAIKDEASFKFRIFVRLEYLWALK